MADVTITVASVATGSGAVLEKSYLAGETITAGMVVYLKTSNNRWMKAQCDGTAEEAGSSTLVGFATHGSLAGQPLVVQTGGQITIGGTVAIGTSYYISATAGAICPYTDLVSTNKVTQVGFGATAAILDMGTKLYEGVAVP